MITVDEIIKGKPVTPGILLNIVELVARLNVVRLAYDKPMIINSGLRTKADQMRINPKAPNSAHVEGMAADIRDADGQLKKWLAENMEVLELANLYMEDPKATPTWVHLQTRPPRSGNRTFKP